MKIFFVKTVNGRPADSKPDLHFSILGAPALLKNRGMKLVLGGMA
jgi:hypothetical protein